MIDYLVPQYFLNFDPLAQAGVGNPSGGMRTKIRTVQKAVKDYQLYTHTRVETLESKYVLVDPLFFRKTLPEQPEEGPEHSVDLLSKYNGYKVLYCTEKEVLRWTGDFREKVLAVFDLVTYNCEYQRRFLEGIGITDMKLLVDPIDCDLFQPDVKEMSVVATGWISSDKNSEFIRDLYYDLTEYDIKRVYVGGSSLWGFNRKSDVRLEYDIRQVSDVFVNNVPQEELVGYIASSAFFCGNTKHDTSSACHAESLATGCVSVVGGHPLYSERPGFYVKPGVSATVEKLVELTDGFNRLPDSELFEKSRNWALENVSFDVFGGQLSEILSGSISVNHSFVAKDNGGEKEDGRIERHQSERDGIERQSEEIQRELESNRDGEESGRNGGETESFKEWRGDGEGLASVSGNAEQRDEGNSGGGEFIGEPSHEQEWGGQRSERIRGRRRRKRRFSGGLESDEDGNEVEGFGRVQRITADVVEEPYSDDENIESG